MTVDLSMINPGDEVTVEVTYFAHTATLSGKVWASLFGALCVGPDLVRRSSGEATGFITRLVSHTPALPDWVTDDDVVVVKDRDGELWVRDGDWWSHIGGATHDAIGLQATYGPCTVYARRADS